MPNLEDLTLAELKNLAKENNVKNISKLKKEDVINIRESYRNKIKTQSALAKEYKVSVGTINNIVNYRTWKNL